MSGIRSDGVAVVRAVFAGRRPARIGAAAEAPPSHLAARRQVGRPASRAVLMLRQRYRVGPAPSTGLHHKACGVGLRIQKPQSDLTLTMARPKKPETLSTISVRLQPTLLDAVDQCAAKLQKEVPLLQVTRTDAVRYLIQLGVEEFERASKKKRGQRRRG